MSKKLLFLIAVIPMLNACSDSSQADCDETQKEYNGKCYNINDCVPGCDTEIQKCVLGECIDRDTCKPECNPESEKCYKGYCIDINSCAPPCNPDSQKCIEGVCYDRDSCVEPCDQELQKCYFGQCIDKYSCAPACDSETEKCFEGQCYKKDECIPECDSYYQKCYQGKCIGVYQCAPACDGNTEKCYQGKCIDINQCAPECDGITEKCVGGKCIGIDDCYPACGENEECVKGTCQEKQYDPNACDGKLCKDGLTYCDETGHWNKCQPGYGCHLGYCLKGLAPECEDGTCSEDKTRECQGGTFVSCGSLETCVEGQCTLTDDTCTPGTCSDDGAYRCDDEGHYKACNIGTACEEGACKSTVDFTEAMLWQTCSVNSDCARGICLFEVTPSRALSKASLGIKDATKIPLSLIDSRIPTGMGLCTQDCTSDSDICDNISTTKQKFSCQLILTGDSPYPPTSETGQILSLPFWKSLDSTLMSIAPYASICRPNDISEKNYTKSFCNECVNSSDCSGTEACVRGYCLPKCTSTDMCPLNFTCSAVENMEDNYCTPNANTCNDCLDADNDGQGYGACEIKGVDCDDTRGDVFYGLKLTPSKCTKNFTDDNCNGKIDYTELIGSEDNCSACSSVCKVGSSANISRVCQLNNGGKALDDSSATSINNTYVYECKNTCTPGYADCDGNPSNGCETQLVEIKGNKVTATGNADTFALDADRDDHAVMADKSKHFCCKSNVNVCYAMPGTDLNQSQVWERVTPNSKNKYSSVIDDCDDNNAKRYPKNTEICDGIDNDCDGSLADDGEGEFIKLDTKTYSYVKASETDSNKLKLKDTCTVYNTVSTHDICSTDGKVECRADGNTYKMVCYKESSKKDDNCDNKDDNCNGQVDEDYVYTVCDTKKLGICSLGANVCTHENNTAEVKCTQLYNARPFDLYGDGVDSDCDGEDWDKDGAIFLETYNDDGAQTGNDSHTGLYNNPVESFGTAFTKARKEADGMVFMHDIFVSKSIITHSTSKAKWGKERVNIPDRVGNYYRKSLNAAYTVPGGGLNSGATSAQIKAAHVKAYQNKRNNVAGYTDYDPNKYLFPSEVWPRKEFTAIYGGFTHTGDSWKPPASEKEFSSYNYVINSNTASVNSDKSLNDYAYEMIGCRSGTLSLKLDHMTFNMSASGVYAKQSGTTFIGLNCSSSNWGCSEITLATSHINVTAPEGLPGASPTMSNHIWNDQLNGVNSMHHWSYQGNGGNYTTNYNSNDCLAIHYSGGHTDHGNDFWGTTSSGYTTGMITNCPGGYQPRGGCGGVYCCSSDDECGDIGKKRNGQSGNGLNSGSGATRSSAPSSSGCDADNVENDTSTTPKGGDGSHGSGGAGGSNSSLSQKFRALDWENGNNAHFIATDSGKNENSIASANGSYGDPGGGGGGGLVYQCYDRAGTDTIWGYAGTGGVGGCGGYGGGAGGTGGSAIGMAIRPGGSAKTVKLYISMTGNSTVKAEGKSGGDGAGGQDGVLGGTGGTGCQWGNQGGAGRDLHCFKSTAGGHGGTGGGGGGGAGGLAGQAYGILAICPSEYGLSSSQFSKASQLSNCNIIMPSGFSDNPTTYATATTGDTKSDGNSGSKGNLTLAGSGGKGGSSTKNVDTVATSIGFSSIGLK